MNCGRKKETGRLLGTIVSTYDHLGEWSLIMGFWKISVSRIEKRKPGGSHEYGRKARS
jgi:hypothetical protein